jgi:hypothetical protein
MKWEWAVGEVVLLALAFYELWSLRKYDKPDAKKDPKNKGG